MRYDYDVLTIGLGPAGMAVSAMGAEMGLRVCAVERDRIGGECMNSGCIPSKALLRTASLRHAVSRFPSMELGESNPPEVLEVFGRIRERIEFINSRKTLRMFDKVDLVLGQGSAPLVARTYFLTFIPCLQEGMGRASLISHRHFMDTRAEGRKRGNA
ncbi:MAG: FAD-dependent oxidoreductase [Candidatus Fermentibacteraceae bacterium]